MNYSGFILSMIFGLSIPTFASDFNYEYKQLNSNQGNVIDTDEGVYINDFYYEQDEFIQLLETAIETESPEGGISTQSAAALIAGT